MSLVAGGARGGSHRVEASKEESLLLTKSLAEMESSRRRSLRKREEKSYVESPDLIFEDETSSSSSTNKAKNLKHVVSNGDVEMESDDDDDEPLDPLPLPKELPPDAVRERKALIRKLQTQLRNEEMSLVLLKKIRQSQVMADQMANSASAKAPAVANNSKDGAYHRATPPPSSGKGASSYKSQGSRHQGHQGSPTPAQIKNLVPDLSQLKPVNVDPKSLPPGLPASLMNMINKGNVKLNNDSVKASVTKVETETPAQKQAAAKLALRKQLEKTLLQIPPPKPPPPEMHFIPNPANTEFICLLGLEECVGKILHEDKENTVQPVPFTCSQCGTDFTPTWKWDKGARGKEVKVICEACVTSNVKKALKAEHTNRLKAAFVKALQQEQELEAHMAAQSAQSARGSSPDTSRSGRSGTSGLPASLDVTVRSASATVRPIPSAHQSSRTASSTPSVTIERAHHRTNATTSSSASGTANSRSTAASITPRHSNNSSNNTSAANLSRMSSLLSGNATPPLNNSVSITSTSSSRTTGNNSSSNNSKNDQSSAAAAMAAAARDSANAMAAAALMGAYDPATIALLQQQLLLGAYGSTGSSGGSSSNSSNRSGGGSSGSSSNNSAAAAALTSQLAAMSQHLMNPLLYNYQALAMAQAMQAAGLSGMSSSGSGSSSGNRNSSGATSSGKGSSSSSQSATNQMLEIQRQVAAAEQLQRQYLLDMIPPGSLGQSWGKK